MKGFVFKTACLGFFLASMSLTAQAQNYRRGDYKQHRGSSYTSTLRTIASPVGKRMHDYRNSNCYTGLRLGLNIASLSFNGTNGVNKNALAGLNLGVVGGYSLSPFTPIYIESGLLYTQKGVQGSKHSEDLKVNMHYLEVPVVFKYKAYLNDGLNEVSVQPFLGGYAALGFAGKTKDFDLREKVNTFGDHAFRNLDAGLRMGCGLEYNNLYLELSYDLGLANVARNNFNHLGYDNFDDKIHTSTFSATLGFNF